MSSINLNKKVNAVGITGNTERLLNEIIQQREKECALVRSKVGIIAELVTIAHKKEVS